MCMSVVNHHSPRAILFVFLQIQVNLICVQRESVALFCSKYRANGHFRNLSSNLVQNPLSIGLYLFADYYDYYGSKYFGPVVQTGQLVQNIWSQKRQVKLLPWVPYRLTN